MSAPDYLLISLDMQTGDIVEQHLPQRASIELFDYMLPKMAAASPTCAGSFEGGFYAGVLTIDYIPQQDYRAVCDLIMDACNKIDKLKPVRASLKAALEADPRCK